MSNPTITDIQKAQIFKLATDAGKLAWNSSHAMSMGTTAEREIYRDAMESMGNGPEARLARMVQTVMESDMRGMSTQAVVAEMREEGARLGLVDTDVDTVLGLAADAYAGRAATRNAEVFDDGIHERLVRRTLPVLAGLQGHDSVAEAEKSFLSNYANHAAAYGNNREAVERLAEGKMAKPKPQVATPTARESGIESTDAKLAAKAMADTFIEALQTDGANRGLSQADIQSHVVQSIVPAFISLRDGILTNERIQKEGSTISDLKIHMACQAVSGLRDVDPNMQGEMRVNNTLLRVKDVVLDRLTGSSEKASPPSIGRIQDIQTMVSDAFRQGLSGAGKHFESTFKSVLGEINTEIKGVLSKMHRGVDHTQSL